MRKTIEMINDERLLDAIAGGGAQEPVKVVQTGGVGIGQQMRLMGRMHRYEGGWRSFFHFGGLGRAGCTSADLAAAGQKEISTGTVPYVWDSASE